MPTTNYDDGSSITYDDGGVTNATQSPAGYLLTDYATNFNPGNLASGATSVLDVLKYGFGRVVDYKTSSLQAANTPPQYAAPPVYQNTGLNLSGNTLLLLGGAVLLFVLLSGGDGKKG